MMYPEEKMAARLLKRKKLTPPYSLLELANSCGEVQFRVFPFKADGITVGIGLQSRPKIYINSDCPETRQQFTLAHEIGHIIIPWHTGTVVSHLEPGSDDLDYTLMEQEANRFAAELLMPTDWLKHVYTNSDSVENFFKKVLADTRASKEAVFYKIFKDLDAAIACARLDEVDGTILQLQRTRLAPHDDHDSNPQHIYQDTDHSFENFYIDGKAFCAWTFKGRNITEVDPRSWREILNAILSDTHLQDQHLSINSIMASAYNKNKHLAEHDICGAVVRAFRSRDGIPGFKEHWLFEQYIVKRVKELKLRKPKKH